MEKQQYCCRKCVCKTYRSDMFQATGGNFANLFNVQNKHYFTVSCTCCGYTELYRGETSNAMNILDFILNG